MVESKNSKAKNRVGSFMKDPRKALFALSLPILIGMVVQALYEFFDTIFVGRLGAESIAALTFSFPLYYILLAFTAGLSAGMGSLIARSLGAKKKREAENAAMHGLLLGLILAVMMFIIGFLSLRIVFSAFGAEGRVLELSLSYMRIILSGVFFLFLYSVLADIFISEGDTKTVMTVQIISLLINIILDPVLIYYFRLGVMGAALTTIAGFILSFILLLYFIRKRSYLKIRFRSFRYDKKILLEIIRVGAPATLMILLLSVYVLFLNKFMAHYGTNYVAAFGLGSQLESFAFIPIFSFSTALLTLVGMFYGAKRYDLLKDVIWYGIRIVVLLTIMIGAIFFVFSPFLFRVFTPDKTLILIATQYMRLDVFTFPLMGIISSVARIMQGMGNGTVGLVTNVVRVFLIAIPLAAVFVYILKLDFLFVPVAQILGGFVAAIISLIWLGIQLKKCKDGCK